MHPTPVPEINKLLAHNNLFAAEVHPLEGSLEAVYLQATALPNRGTHPTVVDNVDTITTADPSAKGVR